MWKLQVLLYSFLIPKEFGVNIGVLSLSAYRVLLILFVPWVIWQLLTHRNFRWKLLDTVALSVCIWPAIALSSNTNILSGVESGGIHFLETFVPFFSTRLMIYRYAHLVSLGKTLLMVTSIMVVFALPEAISGIPIAHTLASAITGNSIELFAENRFGVWRSYGLSDHPIILGTICATALPIGYVLSRRRKLAAGMTGLSLLGVVASASSGPILSVVAQVTLYIWSQLTKGKRYKWWLLIILIASIYVLVDVLSNRDPLKVMFSYLLFSEHNGYVRYNMWAYSFFLAGQSFQSLVIGYGFSNEMMSLIDNYFWSNLMSTSVDSYWLVIMLRYGVTMLFLNILLLALILRANLQSYRRHRLKKERLLIQALFITTLSLSLVACTVHFWGSTASLFFVILAATAMNKRKLRQKSKQSNAPLTTLAGPAVYPVRAS